MQLFINGREIPEPKEGWMIFAIKTKTSQTSFAHPATAMLERTVRDLLSLLYEDASHHILVQPALYRRACSAPHPMF